MRTPAPEPRLIAGIALMCGATLAAGLVLQQATRRVPVWQASQALVAGSVVRAADVHVTEVAGDGATAAYIPATSPVIGAHLVRDIGAGELVPQIAIGSGEDADSVAIASERTRMPVGLHRGQRVDVWWSVGGEDGTPVRTGRVLERVGVVDVATSDLGTRSVVLGVPHAQVQSVVQAMRSGVIDIVAVP